MKKVLVTGATGFVGRYCLEKLLEHGFEVHAVCHARSATHDVSVTWQSADLLDGKEVSRLLDTVRPTHLLHLAWYAVPGKFWTSPENLRWVQATLGLVADFVRVGGRRYVGAGSCAEYDWRFTRLVERSTPLSPSTLYGVCKHGVHAILEAFAQQVGMSVAWGRPFYLYGPHEHRQRLVPSVCLSLLRGEEARCTHGEQIRDFLYVEDVASAFVQLVDSEITGAVNIGSGEGMPIRQVIQTIAARLGSMDSVRLGALPAPTGEPPELVADVGRLTHELGWRRSVSLDEGLARTIAWWKSVFERETA